jgi:hypothetical protein
VPLRWSTISVEESNSVVGLLSSGEWRNESGERLLGFSKVPGDGP